MVGCGPLTHYQHSQRSLEHRHRHRWGGAALR